MTALGIQNIVDGMNETGFAGGVLSLNATKYQIVPKGEEKSALSSQDVYKYLLSTSKIVEDVEDNLKKLYVWRCTLDNRKDVPCPPLHMAVHDASGGNGVVEYIDGNLEFHKRTTGVLTNDPVYRSQLDALSNFVSMNPMYGTAMMVNGVKIEGNFVGNGSVGMPGSTSPMDRFARLNLLVSQMKPPQNVLEARTRIWNLIYTVWAQPGSECAKINGETVEGHTRWAVNMDLTHKKIAVITDQNRTPKELNLKDFDFSPGTKHTPIPLSSEEEIQIWNTDMHRYLALIGTKV